MSKCGLVLLATAALLAGAQADDLPWWKSSVVYQIYPRSFADGKGEGNGTLTGILQHVDYLKDLGVGIVWVSPIYKSPMKDQGYDVSNFQDVNPMFGTLQDAKDLIKALKDKGIRFFMDFVPNHSSDEHPWFNASVHGDSDYKDFYIWRDPAGVSKGQPLPPNNWLSAFKGIAWTYNKQRAQFYLHQFGDFQPDLNYRNSRVVDGMYKNMKFWLDLGVDGFRMDAVPFLVEDDQFKDEPMKRGCVSPNVQDCIDHIYTQNVEETYNVLRELEDRMQREYNGTKYMFLEVYANQKQSMKYFYKDSGPFNFLLIQNMSLTTNATGLKHIVDTYMTGLPNTAWPNWVTGNHDNTRVGTRLGADLVDAANMLVLLLPGTAVTFQGEELGMTDANIPPDSILDCCGRDPERTPFQWNTSLNAGFSRANKTWLPVNPLYTTVNVDSEKASKTSHLSTYKRLVSLRKELVSSTKVETATIGDWVFVFKRTNGDKTYYVVINLDNTETKVSLKSAFPKMPNKVSVHTPSDNAAFKIDEVVDTSQNITLRPRSGLVLSGSAGLVSSGLLLVTALAAVIARYL